MLKENFGERLDYLHRKYLSKDFNQRGLAGLYNVSESTYSRWRRGEILPSPTNLFQICEALKDKVPEDEIDQLRKLYHSVKDSNNNISTYSDHSTRDRQLPSLHRNRMIFVAAAIILLVALVIVLAGSILRANNSTPILDNRDWVPEKRVVEGITLVKVPAGCFTMGNLQGRENEQPTSRVCFDEPYWIAETETTIEQFGSPPDTTCNTNQISGGGLVNGTEPDYPRNCVTWVEAQNYCQTLGMRLPTEAEWEYAVRGPSNFLYPWGNDPISAYAIVRTNYNDASQPGEMLPVRSKPRDISWVGAYDMAGSLQEFTATIYDTVTINGEVIYPYPYDDSDGRESEENAGTSNDLENRNSTTTLRVVRGGSFDRGIERATATFRTYEFYDFVWNAYGFRCAMDN